MKRCVLSLVIAVVVGFPLAFVVAMLLTPVLWKLEPVTGMELAGHSGPSDWVIWLIFAIFATAIFALLWKVLRPRPAA